jgi:hypothetical protein
VELSTTSGPSPGAGTRRSRPGEDLAGHLVELADMPEVERPQPRPTVEAAITRWPSTAWVDPQRNSSTSSMQSRRRSWRGRRRAACAEGGPRPAGPPGRLAGRRPVRSQAAPPRSPAAAVRAGHRPPIIEGDVDLVQHHMRGCIERASSDSGIMTALAAVILPGQGTLFRITPLHAPA